MLFYSSMEFHLEMEEVTEFLSCKLRETCKSQLKPWNLESAMRPHSLLLVTALPITCFRGWFSSIWFCQGLSSLMLQGDDIQGYRGRVRAWPWKLTTCKQTLQAGCMFISNTQRPSHNLISKSPKYKLSHWPPQVKMKQLFNLAFMKETHILNLWYLYY